MTPETIIAVIIAVLGSGGLIGGIVALAKVRPESGRMIVEAAEGAVVVQSGVITELRNDLAEVREEAEREREECNARLEACGERIDRLEARLRHHGINGDELERGPS